MTICSDWNIVTMRSHWNIEQAFPVGTQVSFFPPQCSRRNIQRQVTHTLQSGQCPLAIRLKRAPRNLTECSGWNIGHVLHTNSTCAQQFDLAFEMQIELFCEQL